MHMNALLGDLAGWPTAQQRCEDVNLSSLLNERRRQVEHMFAHSTDDMWRKLPRQHQDAHYRSPQAQF
jgi:hypothetical protein